MVQMRECCQDLIVRQEVKRSKLSSIDLGDLACKTEVQHHETGLSGAVQKETTKKGGLSCMRNARSQGVPILLLKKSFDSHTYDKERGPHPKSCVGLKANGVISVDSNCSFFPDFSPPLTFSETRKGWRREDKDLQSRSTEADNRLCFQRAKPILPG